MRSVAFQSILRNRIRKLPKFLKILKSIFINLIIQFYSIVSLFTGPKLPPKFWSAALELAFWNFGSQGFVNAGLALTDATRAAFLSQFSVAIYVFSNSELERIFSNFFSNFSKIIFRKCQKHSLRNPKKFENLSTRC